MAQSSAADQEKDGSKTAEEPTKDEKVGDKKGSGAQRHTEELLDPNKIKVEEDSSNNRRKNTRKKKGGNRPQQNKPEAKSEVAEKVENYHYD